MKAAVLTRLDKIENRPLTYMTVDNPKLEPNQVLIRIKASGVCASNLYMIEGEGRKPGASGIPTKLPIIPGHEIAGVIEDMGKNVKGLEVGQKAGVPVLYDSCRTCEYCLSGRENICLDKVTTGEMVDGGYAELIAAPYDYISKIPDSLGFEETAPLFCPGVTSYHAVRRGKVKSGQRVGVIGIGGVGHLGLQWAKLAGAETIAIDNIESHLKLAEELGAAHAFLSSDVEDYISKKGKLDAVIIHAPSQNAVDQAVRIVKRDGMVVMAVGGNTWIDPGHEYTVTGSIIGSRQEMNEVLNLASMRKIKVKWTPYKLSEANDVLIKLRLGKIVGRAILIP
jgi:propanol-preferring alcohol dehydrogenase